MRGRGLDDWSALLGGAARRGLTTRKGPRGDDGSREHGFGRMHRAAARGDEASGLGSHLKRSVHGLEPLHVHLRDPRALNRPRTEVVLADGHH